MHNLRALQRAFDLRAYLKAHDPDGKDYGANLAVRDPACGKEQKLWVLTTDKADGMRAGSWICYYCGEGGKDVLGLIQRIEDVDKIEAVATLTSYQRDGKPLADLRELVMQTLDGVQETEVWDDKPAAPVPLPSEFVPGSLEVTLPAYFEQRGLTRKKVMRYNLGWCSSGYFKDRMIIPVTMHDQHQFFVARYMKVKPPTGVKKVLYPKGAKTGRTLFNYDRARHCDQIVIVESVLDAIAVGKSAVASFGTSFSQYQLELLMHTAATEIVIMWDADAIVKAHELAQRLAEFWSLRVVELPDGRDPDEHTRAEHKALIKAAPLLDEAGAFASRVRSRL